MTYKVEKVGHKGEVVIGEELREKLGIGPGWRAYQFLTDDANCLKIYFLPPDDGKPLAGSLAKYVKKPIAPGKEWDEAREMAWKRRAEEKMGIRERQP